MGTDPEITIFGLTCTADSSVALFDPQSWVIDVNYRSRTLRESARGEACVSCGARDETVVWCHSNEQEHGKGIGLKSHDLLGNYLCYKCHGFYDREFGTVSQAERRAWFREQYPKTMVRVCEKLARGELIL